MTDGADPGFVMRGDFKVPTLVFLAVGEAALIVATSLSVVDYAAYGGVIFACSALAFGTVGGSLIGVGCCLAGQRQSWASWAATLCSLVLALAALLSLLLLLLVGRTSPDLGTRPIRIDPDKTELHGFRTDRTRSESVSSSRGTNPNRSGCVLCPCSPIVSAGSAAIALALFAFTAVLASIFGTLCCLAERADV